MKKSGSDAFRNVPVAGTLLGVVAIAALTLAYWGNVTGRERYLQSRNFRLLGDVAEQTQVMLYDSEQIVRGNVLRAAKNSKISDRKLSKDVAQAWAHEVAHLLEPKGEGLDRRVAEQAANGRVAGIDLASGTAAFEPSSASVSEIAEQFRQYRMSVLGTGTDLRFEWTAADGADNRLPKVSFELPATALFTGTFNEARWDRAFSTMGLATPDGRVVFAVGAQAAEMKASGVTSLLPVATQTSDPNLVRFASAIADEPVRIGGIDYRMFTQPCCRFSSLAQPGNSSPSGLVVIGLADEDALRSLSLAISPLLVLAGAAFVLGCLVAWTFLKCSLMGVQQRLRRHDVVNLLASGLFGVALATILLLTIGAYARLSADVDAQLRHLADTVDARFTGEIETAAAQLQRMAAAVESHKCSAMSVAPPSAGQLPNDPCQEIIQPWSDRRIGGLSRIPITSPLRWWTGSDCRR